MDPGLREAEYRQWKKAVQADVGLVD